MSMKDLNENTLKKLFTEADSTPVSEPAKKNAINAAMAAFEHAKAEQAEKEQAEPKKETPFQGLRRLFRLTGEHQSPKGKTMESTQTNTTSRFAFSGLTATACMLGLGIFIGVLVTNQEQNLPTAPNTIIADVWQPPALESAPENTDQPELLGQVADIVAEPVIPAAPQTRAEKSARLTGLLEKVQSAKVSQFSSSSKGKVQEFKRSAPSLQNYAPIASLGLEETVIAPNYSEQGRDRFEHTAENPVKLVEKDPVSTFSIDVDTASYSFVRRQLNRGTLPQKDAVRIEEMLNYFDYDYPLPENKEQPFNVAVAVTDAPWSRPAGEGNKLVHIGIKGYELSAKELPKTNLVFLLDVSGSMNSPDKLPLVKQSMSMLLNQLKPEDTIGIVVYAGAAGTVLEPTPVREKQKILSALQRLNAGGSTAGAQGIKLAYQLAEANFNPNAVNRIMLATDGDFNIGITNRDELKGFVERKRDKGIFLSVLGFGQGNYHDHMMQVLAQNGNGTAAYIDTLSEAQKVLVNEATSTLFTIAKDVKIQVEFNPSKVSEYRLLGYETRQLNREDFNNDAVDAGDIGSGHTVTAIYEVTPVGAKTGLIGNSRYQQTTKGSDTANNEYGFIKVRYKLPEEEKSKLITQTIPTLGTTKAFPAQEVGFATAVSGFAQLLKGGKYTADWSYDNAITLAQANKGDDIYGYRTEFIQLIRKAKIAAEM